jgi:Zn-dependent protease with chaperone function
MRLDTANRSFLAMLGASLVAVWLLCGAAACVLLSLVGYDVARHGVGALTSGEHDLRPAVVLLGLVGAGGLLGLWSLGNQVASSRRLARRVRALEQPLPDALAHAAERAGLGGRVSLVDSDESFSFAYGALAPRVVISRRLVEQAAAPELDAVLEHERYHVRNLDPLKVLIARALPATFFYLPVLRELHRRYVAGRELAADRRAVRRCGRKPLAGALFKVVRGPQWPELRAAAAIGGPELLDVRVSQLETGAEPRLAGVSRWALTLSVLGVVALTAAFIVSVIAYGGPSAVAERTGMSVRPLDIGLGLLCAVPWLVAGALAYRWLTRRARRSPL